MGSQERTCPVCGCELGDGCTSCPICGAEVVAPTAAPSVDVAEDVQVDRSAESAGTSYSALTEPKIADPAPSSAGLNEQPDRRAPRAHGRHAAGKPRSRVGKKKIAIYAAAAAVVIVAIGVVAALVLGVSAHDAGLRDRAGAAKSSASSSGASFSIAEPTDEGNLAANLSARGAVVRAGDYACFAMDDGIYRQRLGGTEAATKVCGVQAASLNYHDGQLYFIERSGGIGDGGNAIKRCTVEDDAAVNTVYEASAGATLSSLALWKDKLYFASASGGTYAVCQLPMGENQQVKQLSSTQAKDVWVFADQGSLIVVTAQSDSWRAQRASLSSSALSLQSWGSGSGLMKVASVSDGCLYFTLSGGTSAGHATRLTKTGELKEFDQVEKVEGLTASEDSLIAVASSEHLTLANAKTGLLYDQIDQIDSWLSGKVPSEVSIGLIDGDLYLVSKNSCMTYDPATGKVRETKVGE